MGGEIPACACPPQVRLRPLRAEDRPRLLQWLSQPEVRRHYLGVAAWDDRDPDWVPGPSGPAAAQRPGGILARAIDGPDGSLLGWVELRDVNWRRRSGELRICLGDPATWGRGYGTAAIRLFLQQAFSDWGLRGVHLRVAAWNERAIRAYARCGFRPEARLRAGRRRADGLEDLLLMTVEAPPQRIASGV